MDVQNISPRVRLKMLLSILILSCGMWPEMELLVPSLPNLKRLYDVSDPQIQQLASVNFTGFLCGVLLSGPLCDAWGRRRVLIGGTIFYLLSGLLALFSPTFSWLLLGRFLQGFAMTGPVIAAGVLMMEVATGTQLVTWIAINSAAVTLCMAGAPLVGAWIQSHWGPTGNLSTIVAIGALGAIPSFFWLPETLLAPKPLSLRGFARGYGTLLQDGKFLSLAIPVCALAASYWTYVGLSALYFVDTLHVPESDFGHFQGPIVACYSVASLATGAFVKRMGRLFTLRVGFFLMALGALSLVVVSSLGLETPWAITGGLMAYVGGMSPVCSILFPASLAHLPPDKTGNAQSLLQGLRLFIASVGTVAMSLLWKGPFLPVALLVAISLIFCAALVTRRWGQLRALESMAP